MSAHDLIFYANRSTPEVVAKGAKGKPKNGYGPQTRRRAATAEEEAKIAKGDWLLVDQSGKKSGETGYKKTKYRPGLVKASNADNGGNTGGGPKVGAMVTWNSSGGRATGKIIKKLTNGQPNQADGEAPQNASSDDPVYLIEVYRDGKPSGTKVQHKGKTLSTNVSLAADRVEYLLALSKLDPEDVDLIMLGSSASLDRSPRKNWVENAGELPPYVREIARSIEKTGKTLSAAIAIAISRLKVWAATGQPDTKAKAVKALAQWEALKAKNRANQAKKLAT